MKKLKRREPSIRSATLAVVNPNAAGIDIGSKAHYVAVPSNRDSAPVRHFGCFTADLYAMAAWLKSCRIDTVAMESTGVYWIPVYQVLEAQGFEVVLVNTAHINRFRQQKTDVSDCQWIQQLHCFGLLRGSFRPDADMVVLRSYIRQRDNLIKSGTTHIHRMQKVLDQMNLQLHKVISDITGLTGMRILSAILAGERDPVKLATLKHPRIQNSTDTIAKALEGDWRDEHLFVLKQEFELYHYYMQMVEACDKKIDEFLSTLESAVDVEQAPLPKAKRKPEGNQPKFDLRTHLYRITGVDLTKVAGFNTLTIQTLISECGFNPYKWPTEKHFASWLGLCPNNKVTGERIKSSSTQKVVNRAAVAFRMAAQALHQSKSALGAFHRRMRSRHGPAKANTATAHKLACIFYRMLKFGHEYVDPGVDYYEKKYRDSCITNLKRSARKLGLTIIESTGVADFVS